MENLPANCPEYTHTMEDNQQKKKIVRLGGLRTRKCHLSSVHYKHQRLTLTNDLCNGVKEYRLTHGYVNHI